MADAGDPATRVVIVNWNGRDYIATAAQSVLRQTVRTELIVVDNASTDDSASELEGIEGVTVLRSDRNVGFGAGINLGARGATSDYLAFLNPDAEASPQWLERLTTWMRKDGVDVATSYIGEGAGYYFVGGRWSPWRGAASTDVRVTRNAVGWINACAMVISRSAFEKLGGFDDRFFLYSEDVDLALRARAAKMRLAVFPERLVEHERHGRSTQTLGDLKASIAFTSRGRLVAKHVPIVALPIAMFVQAIVAPLVHYRALGSTWSAARAFTSGFAPAFRARVSAMLRR